MGKSTTPSRPGPNGSSWVTVGDTGICSLLNPILGRGWCWLSPDNFSPISHRFNKRSIQFGDHFSYQQNFLFLPLKKLGYRSVGTEVLLLEVPVSLIFITLYTDYCSIYYQYFWKDYFGSNFSSKPYDDVSISSSVSCKHRRTPLSNTSKLVHTAPHSSCLLLKSLSHPAHCQHRTICSQRSSS